VEITHKQNVVNKRRRPRRPRLLGGP
jgi:hypothetical protein